jgi:hypothetical protein
VCPAGLTARREFFKRRETMNISFVEKKRPPTDLSEIIVNGKVVGELKEHRNRDYGSPYHAVIHLWPEFFRGGSGMIQGHGDTPGEAIRDAIDTTKAFISRLSVELERFELSISS